MPKYDTTGQLYLNRAVGKATVGHRSRTSRRTICQIIDTCPRNPDEKARYDRYCDRRNRFFALAFPDSQQTVVQKGSRVREALRRLRIPRGDFIRALQAQEEMASRDLLGRIACESNLIPLEKCWPIPVSTSAVERRTFGGSTQAGVCPSAKVQAALERFGVSQQIFWSVLDPNKRKFEYKRHDGELIAYVWDRTPLLVKLPQDDDPMEYPTDSIGDVFERQLIRLALPKVTEGMTVYLRWDNEEAPVKCAITKWRNKDSGDTEIAIGDELGKSLQTLRVGEARNVRLPGGVRRIELVRIEVP